MHTSIRAAALATSAVLAFGLTAPASLAAPHAHAAHTKTHGKAAHTKAHGKAAHDHGKLARAKARLAHEVARKEHALVRNTRDSRFHGIPADQAVAVQGNAALDVALLKSLADQAAAATTPSDVRAAADQVHAVRPENYGILEGELRQAAGIQAALTADPSVVTDQASAALTSAIEKALAYRASDGKAALRSIRADLQTAAAVLESSDPTTPAA